MSDASTAAAEAVSGHVVESGSGHILHMGTLGTTASTRFSLCVVSSVSGEEEGHSPKLIMADPLHSPPSAAG